MKSLSLVSSGLEYIRVCLMGSACKGMFAPSAHSHFAEAALFPQESSSFVFTLLSCQVIGFGMSRPWFPGPWQCSVLWGFLFSHTCLQKEIIKHLGVIARSWFLIFLKM